MPVLEKKISEGYKLSLITFTLKNMNDLKSMLNRFNVTFKKFREKYCIFYKNIVGGVISREITNIGNGWHVHFHCIVVHSFNYTMSDSEFQSFLRTNWEQKTGDSWSIKVDSINKYKNDTVKNLNSLISSVAETFKYMTKLKLVDSSFLKELYEVTYKRRLVSNFGCLYNCVCEEDIDEDINSKDTRELENLVCAVCHAPAVDSSVETYDTLDFNLSGDKIYSFLSKD
jgi:hypothetical protein